MKAVKSNTFLAWKIVFRYMRELTNLGCPADVAVRALNLALLGITVRLLPGEVKEAVATLAHTVCPSYTDADKNMIFTRMFAGVCVRGDGMSPRFRAAALRRHAGVAKWQSLPKEARRHGRLWMLYGDYAALQSVQC